MALYSWIADLSDPLQLDGRVATQLHHLGLDVQPDFCSERQLYAEDPAEARLPISARVKVLVSRLSTTGREWQVEVRSAEPMVRRKTRCSEVASQLQSILPECVC